MAGALALRARIFLALRLWERMPIALLGPHTPATRATLDDLTQRSYLALAPRGAALACGVLAALAASTPRCAALAVRWELSWGFYGPGLDCRHLYLALAPRCAALAVRLSPSAAHSCPAFRMIYWASWHALHAADQSRA